MAEVGILAEDDRVELIEGEIVEVSPPGYRHSAVVSRLNALFAPVVAGRAIVRVQDPVILSEFSAPEPDIAVVRYADDFHESAHPDAGDVLLAVEVADSSAAMDLRLKAWLYAAARVPEYWVVDLKRDRVVVHTSPGPDGYASIRSLSSDDVLTIGAFPDLRWTAAAVLGHTRSE